MRFSISWFVALLSASAVYAMPGEIDPTFGTGGYTGRNGGVTPSGGGDGSAFDAAGGMVVVSGGQIRRFTATGAPDGSWGTNGVVTVPPGSGPRLLYGVAVQADGKIVAAGREGSSNPVFIVVRYASDGTLDTSFGAGGVVTGDFTASGAYSVAVQSDGRILVGGSVGLG